MAEEKPPLEMRVRLGPTSSGHGWDPRFRVNEDLGRLHDIADYFLDQGNYAKAMEIALEFESAVPEHPYALNLVGTILGQQGKMASALRRFEKAMRHAPPDAPELLSMLYSNMGGCKNKLGRETEAEKDFFKSLEYNLTNATTFANIGNIKYSQGKFLEAIHFFDAAVDLSTESPKPSNTLVGAVFGLVACYFRTGQKEKAEEMIEKGKKLPPSHAYFYVKGLEKIGVEFYNRDLDSSLR